MVNECCWELTIFQITDQVIKITYSRQSLLDHKPGLISLCLCPIIKVCCEYLEICSKKLRRDKYKRGSASDNCDILIEEFLEDPFVILLFYRQLMQLHRYPRLSI